MAFSRVIIDFRVSINPENFEFYKPTSNLVGQRLKEYPAPPPCVQETDLFFQSDTTPDKKDLHVYSSEYEAKKICASCKLVYLCLTDALINNERYGIWGGMNRSERIKLREQLRRNRNDVSPVNIRNQLPYLNSAAGGKQATYNQVKI